MKKEINPNDGVHGRWYFVNSFHRWLIKFDRVQEGKIYDTMCYNLDLGEKGDSTKPLTLSIVESFTEATPEEVEKYFPGEGYTNQPEAVQESFDKINAMEQPDERLVYVYTDKEDGLLYMIPKFDPHVGGHNIDEVLSKAEDNSVIYEARPVGVKKIYLEEV